MTAEPRQCHHDCTTHDYTTHITTTQGSCTPVRTDRVCDACGDTLQSFYDSDQEKP